MALRIVRVRCRSWRGYRYEPELYTVYALCWSFSHHRTWCVFDVLDLGLIYFNPSVHKQVFNVAAVVHTPCGFQVSPMHTCFALHFGWPAQRPPSEVTLLCPERCAVGHMGVSDRGGACCLGGVMALASINGPLA